ncbi:HlyD family efflux transporter periplasmic adaptor subunit, partial [bacterium]|nr:HlyD family efflux transporter periplasmic adaptor subunit [bacterium]
RLAREQELGFLKSRLAILREVESMRAELEQAKTGSRLNSLIARDTRIEVERSLTRSETGVIEAQHEIEGIEAERDVFRRQWESRLVEELVTKRGERDGYLETLVKAQKRQQMVNLETPVDAVVLEVASRSVGSIIQSAEALFKLVPLDSRLEIEAKVEARELARIAVGDEVQVKFDTFAYQEHGMGKGVVKVISGDAFSDSKDTQTAPYYKVRVELTDIGLRDVPEEFRLLPGLPVTAEIKIGKRSIMGYFLRPIPRGMNESMREP